VCEDSRTPEKAEVCEAPLAAGEAASELALRGRRGGRSDGPGIAPGSLTGLAERGASVEIAREPGENHTRTLASPVFMIENIRTSKYDRCSDT
jgi:hypothetical protein